MHTIIVAVSSKHPYAKPISIRSGYFLWLHKFIEKCFAFNFGFRNDFIEGVTISKTVQMPRTRRTVRIAKKMNSSEFMADELTCICFCFDETFSLLIQIKFYDFHIVLGVSIAINAYPRNIIVINMKVIRMVFTKRYCDRNEMLFLFLTNYRQKIKQIKQSSKQHMKHTKDCPDASDELDCEVADESQTRNPTFKNARTFPLANAQNSLTAPR